MRKQPRRVHGSRQGLSMSTRTETDLVAAQLRAIDAWNLARGTALRAREVAGVSREVRLDLSRRLDVLRAQHDAIVERAEAHLRGSIGLLDRHHVTRTVVVHRSEWFTDKVSAGLATRGVEVVARLSNGAQAIGCVVAEQPDLLLVEDVLAMVPGVEVVREARQFSPETRIGAQVEHESGIAEILEAGASAAWARRVPPADVASGLLALCVPVLQDA